jgi:hypothetical protein
LDRSGLTTQADARLAELADARQWLRQPHQTT